jgi:sugar lactone lactonase YvrE
MSSAVPETLAGGLKFPESPRWHEGRLWISDMHGHRVVTIDDQGGISTVVSIDDKPSGLGFLEDGTPLVVSMRKHRVLALRDGQPPAPYADLSGLVSFRLNDMCMDGRQHVYVDNMTGGRNDPSSLVMIRPDLSYTEMAHDLIAPNGIVITPDNRTLIVAELTAQRLRAYDIADDGTLTGGRIFADTGDAEPDGIALDAEGAVWISSPNLGVFRRILPGGRVAQEIRTPGGRWGLACMLGGDDRRTLFMATTAQTRENHALCADFESDQKSTAKGYIDVLRVDVPGAGWP